MPAKPVERQRPGDLPATGAKKPGFPNACRDAIVPVGAAERSFMTYRTLLVNSEARIVSITLNRPEVRNGLNAQMRLDLTHALSHLPEGARVVVLTGAGQSFCSGQDLGDVHAGLGEDVERTLREEYEPMLRALIDCPVPTIAGVNGAAAGAGANLALAADVVIAAESAVFIQAFARIGLIPDAGGTYWLPRLVGQARAMGAALFAEPVTALQAAEWGMIWQAVPDMDFGSEVRACADRIAAGPAVAHALIRRAIRASAANNLEAQLDLEATFQGEAGRSRDFREGVLAFREKRQPRFEGR
jgi:2-(1,2-epoxy-1,2-dihydrophenyl)acetyl-CoA isomerase